MGTPATVHRVLNFSAGPAVLPKTVLQQVQAELVDWHGSGMSVMEMSHRGKEFMGIAAETEADLREVMGKAVEDFVGFDEAYSAADWSRFSGLPAFEPANRTNAYGQYLLMERELLQRK